MKLQLKNNLLLFLNFQVEITSALTILICTATAVNGQTFGYLIWPILKLLFDILEITILVCHIKSYCDRTSQIILPTHELETFIARRH